VTHVVFSPVLCFDFVSASLSCSALAASGSLMVFVLGLLFFSLFFDLDFGNDELELVAAAGARDLEGDEVSMAPPPSAPGHRNVDAAAVDAADEKDEEEAAALSRVHSSLWPARHAARWQACLQYLRCRQPEQNCSG